MRSLLSVTCGLLIAGCVYAGEEPLPLTVHDIAKIMKSGGTIKRGTEIAVLGNVTSIRGTQITMVWVKDDWSVQTSFDVNSTKAATIDVGQKLAVYGKLRWIQGKKEIILGMEDGARVNFMSE